MGHGIVRAVGTAVMLVTGMAAASAAGQDVAGAAPLPTAVAVVDEAEPAMPAGGSPNFQPPVRDAFGYVTPNRNLSPEETIWHMRVALNVAALGCRGADAAEMVDGYNALLTADKELLAAASTAMGARYKARYGSAWQASHDDAMTRQYNFWALPPVQGKFCGIALQVLHEAAAVQPVAFSGFAAQALPRLEAPMIAFFGEFETYIAAREGWRTRRARAMIAAAVPPVPVAAEAVQAAALPAGLVRTAATVPVRAGAGEP